MKRLFSMLLAAVMILACLPMTALACGVADISIGSAKVNFSEKNDQTVEIEITFSGDEHELSFVFADVVVDKALHVKAITGSPEYAANGNQIAWMFSPAVDDNGDWLPEKDESGEFILSAESLSIKANVVVPAGTPAGKYNVTLSDVCVGDVNTDEYNLPATMPVGTIEVVEVGSGDHTHIYGDANLDGRVTAKDASLVARKAARKEITGDFCETCADVNADGRITAKDASMIARRAARKPVEFEAEKK